MTEFGGECWLYGWVFGRGRGQGLAAGVSHLCQGAAVAVYLLIQLHAGARALNFLLFFPFSFLSPSPLFLFFPSHPQSQRSSTTSLCGSPPPLHSLWKLKLGRERASGWEGLTVGQIGSWLSLRPFTTYLWMCAHLHCRTHIQNCYYCSVYFCVSCYHNLYNF